MKERKEGGAIKIAKKEKKKRKRRKIFRVIRTERINRFTKGFHWRRSRNRRIKMGGLNEPVKENKNWKIDKLSNEERKKGYPSLSKGEVEAFQMAQKREKEKERNTERGKRSKALDRRRQTDRSKIKKYQWVTGKIQIYKGEREREREREERERERGWNREKELKIEKCRKKRENEGERKKERKKRSKK